MKKINKKIIFITYLLTGYLLLTPLAFASNSNQISLSDLLKHPAHPFQLGDNAGDLQFQIPNDSTGKCVGLSFQFWASFNNTTFGCAPNNSFKQQVLQSICATNIEQGQTYYIWPSDFYNLMTAAGASYSNSCTYISDPNNSANNAAYFLNNCVGNSCNFNNGVRASLPTLGMGGDCTTDSNCNTTATYPDSFQFLTLTLAGGGTSIPNDNSQDFRVITENGTNNTTTINAYKAFTPTGDHQSLPENTTAYYLSSSENGSRQYDPSSFAFYTSTDDSGMNFVPMDVESGVTFATSNASSDTFPLGILGATHEFFPSHYLKAIKFIELATMRDAAPGETSDYNFDLTVGGETWSNVSAETSYNGGVVEAFTSETQSIDPVNTTYSLTSHSNIANNRPGQWELLASIDYDPTEPQDAHYFPISTQFTTPNWSSSLNTHALAVPINTVTGHYTVNFPPSITSLSTNTGPNAGGNEISISGSFLSLVNSVTFGGNTATIISESPNKLLVQVPAKTSSSNVDVVITSPAGSATDAGAYTYSTPAWGPPTISSVSPSYGSNQGGTAIDIAGSFPNPNGGCNYSVTIDSIPVTGVGCAGTHLYFTTPADPNTATLGHPVPVTVTDTEYLPYYATTVFSYTYNDQPSIDFIDPSFGSIEGGSTVHIHGQYLGSITNVNFATYDLGAPVVISNSEITVTSPQVGIGSLGPQDVILTNDAGQTTQTEYNYQSNWDGPSITGVSPSHGSEQGGDAVVISGSFTNPDCNYTVTFDNNPVTIHYCFDNELNVVTPGGVPNGGTPIAVTVTDNITHDFATGDYYTYDGPPTFGNIDPNSGPTAGGNVVDIYGNYLGSITQVSFGGAEASIDDTISDSQIQVTAPPGEEGSVDVTLTNTTGSIIEPNAYTYLPQE